MANKNADNLAYMNFIDNLNEILSDIDVSKLSFS